MIRWCGKGGFADRKCTLDDTLDRWFDNRFPPLSIYHGGRDYLVLAEPLIERMKTKEKDVNVIKVTKLDLSEVCLFLLLLSVFTSHHPVTALITTVSLCGLLTLRARSLTFSTAISTGQQKLSNGPTPPCWTILNRPDLNTQERRERRGMRCKLRRNLGWMYSMRDRRCLVSREGWTIQYMGEYRIEIIHDLVNHVTVCPPSLSLTPDI